MPVLTKAQRAALKRLFDRDELVMTDNGPRGVGAGFVGPVMTYREFRKTVQYGYDCIMVRWCNMWLGIEPDGYTHS